MIPRQSLLVVVLSVCSLSAAAKGPFVEMSFDEACKLAEQEKKVVFIDFYTTWCLPCKMMDESTFKDQKVIDWLASKTVAIKVDADRNTTLAGKFRVDAYPTLLFAKPDGSEMDRMVGMLQTDAFLQEAKAASALDHLGRTPLAH